MISSFVTEVVDNVTTSVCCEQLSLKTQLVLYIMYKKKKKINLAHGCSERTRFLGLRYIRVCYVPGVTRRLRKPTSWLASNKLCLKFNKFI